jgi:mycofactocin biosynthesis protein MftB
MEMLASEDTPIESDPLLERVLSLHPKVALRPEPFGALAYHFDNRRLVFLKHPDVVMVVRALRPPLTVREVLTECGIHPRRWSSFQTALTSLLESEMLHEH